MAESTLQMGYIGHVVNSDHGGHTVIAGRDNRDGPNRRQGFPDSFCTLGDFASNESLAPHRDIISGMQAMLAGIHCVQRRTSSHSHRNALPHAIANQSLPQNLTDKTVIGHAAGTSSNDDIADQRIQPGQSIDLHQIRLALII